MRTGEAYSWEERQSEIFKMAKKKGIAAYVIFELTPLCNLNCRMCYIKLNVPEMKKIGRLLTASKWIDIATQAADQGALELLITGGEPFTHPDFMQIYEAVSKMGFLITLYTNSVLLNDDILALLKDYPPSEIAITLYGASRETYKKVCGSADAFDATIRNIQSLKNVLGNTRMNIRSTIVRDNVRDLHEMMTISEQMDAAMKIDFGTYKAIRGAKSEILQCRMSPVETAETYIRYAKDNPSYSDEDKIREALLFEEKLEQFKGPLKKDKDIDAKKKKMSCRAASTDCAISWDGYMLPCNMFSEPKISVMDKTFCQAWDEMKNLRKSITRPDRCLMCKYESFCGRCPAETQIESGTYKDGEGFSCMYNSPVTCGISQPVC